MKVGSACLCFPSTVDRVAGAQERMNNPPFLAQLEKVAQRREIELSEESIGLRKPEKTRQDCKGRKQCEQ